MFSHESESKTASKSQLEEIVKLKSQVGLPVGNIWSYTSEEARRIIRILQTQCSIVKQ